jgi:single-stranded DNA-binding protein
VKDDLNSVHIVGNLIRDPVFGFDKDEGLDVCDFEIATCRYPVEGEKEVNYFNVRVYSKDAMNRSGSLVKGNRAMVSGFLRKESTSVPPRTVVVAESVEWLHSKQGGADVITADYR